MHTFLNGGGLNPNPPPSGYTTGNKNDVHVHGHLFLGPKISRYSRISVLEIWQPYMCVNAL